MQLLQAHHSFGETVCFAGAAFPQCKEVHIILAFFVKDLVGNTADAVFREGDKMLRCRRCAVPFCIAAFLDHEFHVGIQNPVAFQGDQSRPQTSVVGIHHQRITVFLGGMEIFARFQAFQNTAGVVGSSHRWDQHILYRRFFQDQQLVLDDQLVCAFLEVHFLAVPEDLELAAANGIIERSNKLL